MQCFVTRSPTAVSRGQPPVTMSARARVRAGTGTIPCPRMPGLAQRLSALRRWHPLGVLSFCLRIVGLSRASARWAAGRGCPAAPAVSARLAGACRSARRAPTRDAARSRRVDRHGVDAQLSARGARIVLEEGCCLAATGLGGAARAAGIAGQPAAVVGRPEERSRWCAGHRRDRAAPHCASGV